MWAAICGAAVRTKPVRHKDPITIQQLQSIVHFGVLTNSNKDRRTAVLALLMFAALLRVNEAVKLLWTDLKSDNNGIEVRVQRAKNDVEGLGRSTFVKFPKGSPAESLWRLWAETAKDRTGPLFTSIKGGALSVSTAAKDLKVMFATLNLPQSLSSHSLRTGATSAEAARGVNLDQLQRRGRWKSASGMASYLRDSVAAQGGWTNV